MNQTHGPSDIDQLALEYLRLAAAGQPPDLAALAAHLPDAASRAELRALVETAEWASSTFPPPFRRQSTINHRYVLREQVRSSSFGRVWRALDRERGSEVALLLFHPFLDDAPEAALRLERAGLSRLSHDGIARVLDSGRHEGTHFLVTEFVAGPMLDTVLWQLRHRGTTALPRRDEVLAALGAPSDQEPSLLAATWPRTVANIVVGVLDALAAAHALDLHHGDLRPENIVLAAGARPMLLDFRLAWFGFTAAVTRSGGLFGTVAYLAPEQLDARHRCGDARTDVFQTGLLLYELLTLQPARTGDDRPSLLAAVRSGAITPPRRLRPQVPRRLAAICERALQRDPNQRQASVEEFKRDLTQWLATPPFLTAVRRAVGRALRRPAVVAACLFGLAALALAWFAS